MSGPPDVAIVGSGIAGASMATVLSRSGLKVLVLERQRAFRDRVRGEFMQPWGVAEAQQLQLTGILEGAGGLYAGWSVPYDETRPPEAAEAGKRDMSQILPNVPGSMAAGHPASCEALLRAAEAAGAEVRRGVDNVHLSDSGQRPGLVYELNGVQHAIQPRLVIGADGRNSTIRAEASIELNAAAPTHLVAGMLAEGVPEWPRDTYSVGTQGDVMYFVFPQDEDRVRLYFCTALEQRDRFAGPEGRARFLETFRGLSSLPYGETIANATPIGPCATLTGEDTWTDIPFADGVALIGDAAGYNDPIIGEGLSLALRDVRILSSLLTQSEDWCPPKLMPYAEERRERMRRMRFTASLMAARPRQRSDPSIPSRLRSKNRCDDGSWTVDSPVTRNAPAVAGEAWPASSQNNA